MRPAQGHRTSRVCSLASSAGPFPEPGSSNTFPVTLGPWAVSSPTQIFNMSTAKSHWPLEQAWLCRHSLQSEGVPVLKPQSLKPPSTASSAAHSPFRNELQPHWRQQVKSSALVSVQQQSHHHHLRPTTCPSGQGPMPSTALGTW